jgi:Flp pilus assembly pilin Flp
MLAKFVSSGIYEYAHRPNRNIIRSEGLMERLTKWYVKAREFQKKLTKGQTMTEYALILAAVAVVVFVTYEVMGQKITALVQNIDSDLSAAS